MTCQTHHTWAGNCIVLQKPLAAGKAAIPAQVFHSSLDQWTTFWAAKAARAAIAVIHAKAAKAAMAARPAIPAIKGGKVKRILVDHQDKVCEFIELS